MAAAFAAMPRALPLAGIGLKASHLDGLRQQGSRVDFFEVHAENHMVDGGPQLRQLAWVRERWPLSVHGVGLSIGGATLDARHLARLATLVRRFEPRWVSEHLAWSSHGGTAFNDLLPLPYDQATLERVVAHIHQVQDTLGRTLLLENPSTCVEFASSTFTEARFLAEIVARTGCGLLLDVNNLYVSACNHGRDPQAALDELLQTPAAAAVGEIHLAGHLREQGDDGQPLWIDTHGAPVADPVWALYERAIARLGPVPTLIERDNHLPPRETIEDEALRARAVQVLALALPPAGLRLEVAA